MISHTPLARAILHILRMRFADEKARNFWINDMRNGKVYISILGPAYVRDGNAGQAQMIRSILTAEGFDIDYASAYGKRIGYFAVGGWPCPEL